MFKMTDNILIPLEKINVLFTYQDADLVTTLQSVEDLDSVKILLQFYTHCMNNGSKSRINFSINHIIKHMNTNNIDTICNVLTLALRIQLDPNLSMVELKQAVETQEDKLLQLKLLNILLIQSDCEMLTHLNLDVNYLKVLLRTCAEYEQEVQNYLIVHILNSYTKLYEVDEILQAVWHEVWKSQNLQLMCGLSGMMLSDSLNLFKLENYWHLLQEQLREIGTIKYKSAMFLLRVNVDTLKNHDSFASENNIIEFTNVNKVDIFKSINKLCILLDISCEKQLHLIEPSLASLTSITNLHPTWLKLIYTILLNHSHISIVYTTIIILLRQELDFQEHFGDVIKEVLRALNNSECTLLTKQTFKEINIYTKKLQQANYDTLLQHSLDITWVPVAFWLFYKNVIGTNQEVSISVLNEIIKNSKRLPHKYIRKGCLDLIYNHVHHLLTHKAVQLKELQYMLLEFLMDDNTRFYASKLINSKNLIVDNIYLNDIKEWLVEEHPNLYKIDLIVEIVNRKNIPFSWIRDKIQIPFKKKKYQHLILDRLTYAYCIRMNELEQYLIHRLEVDEDTFKICHIDKAHSVLIEKCTQILTGNESCIKQSLAFEILFYANESRFKAIYKYWMFKILQKKEKISSNLALGFVNLLTKVPLEYIMKEVVKLLEILEVYQLFFSTQPDEVSVKIFRNMDLILEHITNEHQEFITSSFTQLKNMRKSEHFEMAARYFIRSIALSHGKIDEVVLKFTMQELFSFSKFSDTITYYSVLYFKHLKLSLDIFPVYEFILFGGVHSKEESAEYEVCRDIYFNTHAINPCFRTAEIHKWAIENILSDLNDTRINKIIITLIDKYKYYYKKRYFPDSLIHLHKLRIMQTISFVIPYVTGETKDQLKGLLVESFCEESHQPSVRQLMQYILIQLLKGDVSSLEFVSKTIDAAEKMHTSTITGFIPILYGLDLIRNNVEFSMNLIETMLPWTMGAHFKLRLYSQFVICKICDKNNTNRKFKQKYDSVHKAVETVLAATTQIDHAIKKDIDLIKYIHAEKPHTDSRRLIYLVSVHIPETTNVNIIEWEYFKIKNAWSQYTKENQLDSHIQFDTDREVLANVQKKITPWQEFFEAPKKLGQLIVITTLIESSANLGGLSRTCEIFGVRQMVVSNSKIVNDKEFQSLSMSSEKLVDIIEVKVADLKVFILRAKDEGFKCVGAEQTAESIALNSYEFDEKTLILLGNERSGILPNLIPLLDVCVEIPQLGMIRSFNVHVAGAMFIWEYTKQHMIR